MHIFPGLFYFEGEEQFFRSTYTSQLLSILNQHQDRIQMLMGAHIHWGDIRAPISTEFPNLDVVIYASPSVSPIFNNNPGYSVMDLNAASGEVVDLKWRYLQLYSYIFLKYKSFATVNPLSLFGIDINKPESVRSYVSSLQSNANLFGVSMAAKVGYNWIFQQMSGLLFPIGKMFMLKALQQNVVCAMRHYEMEAYHECEYKANK